MGNLVDELQTLLVMIKQNSTVALLVVGVVLGIHFINAMLGYRLNIFGIYPRHPMGISGIVLSPVLHGNFNHVFFNCIPLFILSVLLLSNGINHFICVTTAVILLSGIATWFFGRKAIHVGASSVIMGYWSYLLVNTYEHFSATSVALAIICIYYLGGLFSDLFPRDKNTSWEGHLFGFIAGIVTNLYIC